MAANDENPAVDARRALSFGERAELYDRVRPTYPPGVVSLLAGAEAPESGLRVADVGAGTGKLTALLVSSGLDVDAVEPDEGMRTVLARRVPAARVHAGTGENLPFADASMDVVVYGQSWHWVDDAAGAREARRVLKPGGVLAMFWNIEQPVAWVTALEAVMRTPPNDQRPPPDLAGFEPAEDIRLTWERSQDLHALVDYVLSHSAVAVLEDGEQAEVLAAARRLGAEHPDLRGRDQVLVPMETVCWVFRRADDAPPAPHSEG